MRKFKLNEPFLIFFLAFILIAALTVMNQSNTERINIENASPLNDDWQVSSTETVTLPNQLDVPKDQPYRIYKTLDETFNDSTYLLIRTSLANLVVRIDNQVIYEMNYEMI